MSEFWKALSEFVPPPVLIIEYRIYHKGEIPLYALSNPVDSTNWPIGDSIVITRQQYDEFRPAYNKVIGGKLIETMPIEMNRVQLTKDPDGEYISIKDNLTFVATNGDRYKQIEVQHEVGSSRK